jgi:hypothetical protein
MFLAWWFNRWSLKEDLDGHDVGPRQDERDGRPGTSLLRIQHHLHGRGLDPVGRSQWFSTIFGMLFMVNQALTAMAFLISLMVICTSIGPCRKC